MTSREKVQEFMRYIEVLMIERNLKVPDLARKMKRARGSIYVWFNDKSIPTLESVFTILQALGFEGLPSSKQVKKKLQSHVTISENNN